MPGPALREYSRAESAAALTLFGALSYMPGRAPISRVATKCLCIPWLFLASVLLVGCGGGGGNTAQHQCFVGATETAALTLLDRDNSASISMGDRVDVDYSVCGLALINIANLRRSFRVEVRESVRSKSGDVFVRARVESVGDFRGLARRADPLNGIPNDINTTMTFAFEVLTFGWPALGRLQVMAVQDDAVVLHQFDGAAFDRLERRLTRFEFEHRLGRDGR